MHPPRLLRQLPHPAVWEESKDIKLITEAENKAKRTTDMTLLLFSAFRNSVQPFFLFSADARASLSAL